MNSGQLLFKEVHVAVVNIKLSKRILNHASSKGKPVIEHASFVV